MRNDFKHGPRRSRNKVYDFKHGPRRSRNKVSVGEPAEGSFTRTNRTREVCICCFSERVVSVPTNPQQTTVESGLLCSLGSPRESSPYQPTLSKLRWSPDCYVLSRDAFVVPLECVSAFAVVLQGRIPHLLQVSLCLHLLFL